MATAVLAVGARLRGQASRSTPASSTTSLPRAREDSARPTIAILAVPRRFRWGSTSSNSPVSPLLESRRQTSSDATTPKSPWRASTGLRKRAINPMDENVAAIFRATMPLLPTPVITSLARWSAQRSSRARAASTSAADKRSAAEAIALASSCRQRVRAYKRWIRDDQVVSFTSVNDSPGVGSAGCAVRPAGGLAVGCSGCGCEALALVGRPCVMPCCIISMDIPGRVPDLDLVVEGHAEHLAAALRDVVDQAPEPLPCPSGLRHC